MTTADRIRKIREERGWSQEDLAKRLGLKDKSSVCRVEKQGNNVTTKSIRRYAEALNTTIPRIMGWSDSDDITEHSERIEREGMEIYEDEESKIGAPGIALRIALYNMTKEEIQKLYDIAKVMYPAAFE